MNRIYVERIRDLTVVQAERFLKERSSPSLSVRDHLRRQRTEVHGIYWLKYPSGKEVNAYEHPNRSNRYDNIL